MGSRWFLGLGFLLFACGSDSHNSSVGGSGGGSAASTGGSSFGGQTSSGGASTSSNGGTATGSGGASATAGGASPGGAAAAGGARGMPDASVDNDGGQFVDSGPGDGVDLYLLIDTSGSMQTSNGDGGSKWGSVSDALEAFFSDPRNAGARVGLGHFPGSLPGAPQTCTTDADCTADGGNFGTCVGGSPLPFLNLCPGCYCANSDPCDPAVYATPTIPLSLTADRTAITDALSRLSPGGGTPTRPALEGSLEYVEAWSASHKDRKVAIVLLTDGEPTGCTTNTPADVATVAATGFSGSHPIKTYVIGIGDALAALDQVALAGGTTAAQLVNPASNTTQELADALNSIRVAAAAP